MGLVSLVVMERGSDWPGHVGDFETLVAVGVGEDGLLERTRRRLDLLRAGRQQVRIAVLACNDATDVASAGRRAELAHELLTAVAAEPFGRLVVTSPETAPPRLRQELLSLAGALTDKRTSATVSVRFGKTGDVSSEPSVRKCVPEVWQRRLLPAGAGS